MRARTAGDEQMAKNRDDFTESTKRKIGRRAGWLCSFPGCRASTEGATSDDNGHMSVGTASHICAAAPGGPRYDEKMSPDERRCGRCFRATGRRSLVRRTRVRWAARRACRRPRACLCAPSGWPHDAGSGATCKSDIGGAGCAWTSATRTSGDVDAPPFRGPSRGRACCD